MADKRKHRRAKPRKKQPIKRRAKPRKKRQIPDPYAQSGSKIRELLESLGAEFVATDVAARRYQSILSGERKLRQAKGRLSQEERTNLAAERRRIMDTRTGGKHGRPVSKELAKFHKHEVELAKRRKITDLASEADRKLTQRNQRVFFIPNDKTKLYKKWDDFDNFVLFIRRPYYRKAVEQELAKGRFVIGTLDPSTHTIREDTEGNPIIDHTLGKKRRKK